MQLLYAHAGFGPEAVDYAVGWDLQREVHARRVADEVPDCCLLLEHQPVYTAGKRTAVSDRPVGDPGAPVIDVDRGGKITWHGPGQLTAYPIIKLRQPVDVVAYVRALEEAMIRVCVEFGVTAVRVPGRGGAWVPGSAPGDGAPGDGAPGDGAPGDGAPGDGAPGSGRPGGTAQPDRKVGAIGARVAKGVTMHGLALNCDSDLSWFDRIVPCGIRDAGVTSLTQETGIQVSVADVTPLLERHLAAALGYRDWRRLHSVAPLAAIPRAAAS
jgi:lipoyl(octanoyl) transferase